MVSVPNGKNALQTPVVVSIVTGFVFVVASERVVYSVRLVLAPAVRNRHRPDVMTEPSSPVMLNWCSAPPCARATPTSTPPDRATSARNAMPTMPSLFRRFLIARLPLHGHVYVDACAIEGRAPMRAPTTFFYSSSSGAPSGSTSTSTPMTRFRHGPFLWYIVTGFSPAQAACATRPPSRSNPRP